MSDAQKEWFRQRIAAIHERVSAYDVLRANGVELQSSGEDREEQFSCPFHGADNKPSARVYPGREGNPSHAWCFVCQESGWDAIGLWRKFNNLTFGQALYRIEREFDLATPEAPRGGEVEAPTKDSESREAFKRVYLICEQRLIASKRAYRLQNDMVGYLKAGSILDRTKSRVDAGAWTPEKGLEVLDGLRKRIIAKACGCPGD
jgi:hypothetical protein